MKLCMIAPYSPDVGGISDYTFNLVSELKKIPNLEVYVIARKIAPLTSLENIFYIISRKNAQRSFLQFFEELKTFPGGLMDAVRTFQLIKKIRPDVVHVQYEPGLYNLFFCPIL